VVCSLSEVFFETSAGPGNNIYVCARAGACIAHQSAYLDTANLDYWFCDAANAWQKLVSTTNSDRFSLIGQRA